MMLKLKLQYFGHLMRRVDSLEKTLMWGGIGGQEEKGTTEDEMTGWYHWLNGHEFECSPGFDDGQGGLAFCNSGGRRVINNWATELNWIYANAFAWNSAFLWDSCQSFYCLGWLTLLYVISKYTLWVRDLVPLWVLIVFLSVISTLLIDVELPVKDKQGVTLSAPFWCLCQNLSLPLLYFNKTLLHKSSEWSSLVTGTRLNCFPPEAKNPGVFHDSATALQYSVSVCFPSNVSLWDAKASDRHTCESISYCVKNSLPS